MFSDLVSPSARPAPAAIPDSTAGSYLDWAAVIAGTVFALALSFLLISFGAGLGLSLSSPYRGEGVSASWLAIATGIWFVWVMVTSFGAGGYLTGRMRRRAGDATPAEVEARDGTHGLIVWATATLISAVLLASGIGGLVSAGGSAVVTAVDAAGDAAGDVASSDYFANVMLRNAQGTQASADQAPDQAPDQATEGATSPATAPAPGPAPDPADIRDISPAVQQEIAGIIARSLTDGAMAERDSAHLARLVAANSDLDAAAARDRVDMVNAEIADARAAALAAVEKARRAGIVMGFVTAATLLIGAVAAFFSATAGGRHRDDGLGMDMRTTRR